MPRGDRSRINLKRRDEVTYWTEKLGVTEECLRETVAQFGDRVIEVREAITRAQLAGDRRPARRALPSRSKT